MNDKLKRHIKNTAQILHLNESQAEYLESCIQMAYFMGEKSGMKTGRAIHDAYVKRMDEISEELQK